jgi:hypothetical protein
MSELGNRRGHSRSACGKKRARLLVGHEVVPMRPNGWPAVVRDIKNLYKNVRSDVPGNGSWPSVYVLNRLNEVIHNHLMRLAFFMQYACMRYHFRYSRILVARLLTFDNVFVVENPRLILNAAVHARDVNGMQARFTGYLSDQMAGIRSYRQAPKLDMPVLLTVMMEMMMEK